MTDGGGFFEKDGNGCGEYVFQEEEGSQSGGSLVVVRRT